MTDFLIALTIGFLAGVTITLLLVAIIFEPHDPWRNK